MADTAITKTPGAKPEEAGLQALAMRRQMLREFWFYFSENRGVRPWPCLCFLALVVVAVLRTD